MLHPVFLSLITFLLSIQDFGWVQTFPNQKHQYLFVCSCCKMEKSCQYFVSFIFLSRYLIHCTVLIPCAWIKRMKSTHNYSNWKIRLLTGTFQLHIEKIWYPVMVSHDEKSTDVFQLITSPIWYPIMLLLMHVYAENITSLLSSFIEN